MPQTFKYHPFAYIGQALADIKKHQTLHITKSHNCIGRIKNIPEQNAVTIDQLDGVKHLNHFLTKNQSIHKFVSFKNISTSKQNQKDLQFQNGK